MSEQQEQEHKNLYEGLFLMNLAVAGELSDAVDQLRDVLTRARADVQVLTKWSERKLAYPIKNQKRGVYLLAYFDAPPHLIANIERDCRLSDSFLRTMILRAEHIGEEELEVARKEADLDLESKLREGEGEGEEAGDAKTPEQAQPAEAGASTGSSPSTSAE